MEDLYAQHETALATVALDEQHPHFNETSAGTTKASPLNNFVTIFTTRHSSPLTIAFEAYCSALQAVEITIGFGGSVNFAGHASTAAAQGESGETTLRAVVRPFTRVYLGYLSVVDELKRASLKVQFDWSYAPPSEDEARRYFAWSRARLSEETVAAAAARFPSVEQDRDNAQTMQLCAQRGVRFVDLEFPPALRSLDQDAERESEELAALRSIEWKRPRDFMKGEVDVFLDSISAGDINQGALGDCWFLSALAALTEFPELVRDIFIDESEKYNEHGVYNLSFVKHGLEQVVRVDDFFPCSPGIYAGPKYSRCAGNELWVLLAEKAFAKLHGSYKNITAGFTAEALMDLTGAPCKTYRLDDPLVLPKIATGELWRDIESFDENKYLLTVSTPGVDPAAQADGEERAASCEANGLVPGHAYTLVTCVEVQDVRLCQLRNPWGSLEWNGDWSDASPLWTEEMKSELEAALAARGGDAQGEGQAAAAVEIKDDGLFWISFSDLCAHFNTLSVCFVKHKAYTARPWLTQRRKFFFDFDVVDKSFSRASVGAENAQESVFKVRSPLYALDVQEEGEFCFTVHQQDKRCPASPAYIDIGVAVLQKNLEKPGKFHLITGTGITADRQTPSEPLCLAAGEYIVVPLTAGCKLRSEWEESLIARALENDKTDSETETERVRLTEKDANGVTRFSAAVEQALREVFAHLDVDGDGALSKVEFDALMVRTEGCGVSRAAFAHVLNKFESDDECKAKNVLSFQGFLHAQLFAFHEGGCKEKQLARTLKALGFDEKLSFRSGRAAALSVHGTAPFALQGLPHNEHTQTEAQEMVIAANGKVSLFDDGRIAVYVYRSGYQGASFMVENRNTVPLVFSLDMSTSVNVISHRGALAHTDLVPAGESVVFHHLAPRDIELSWTWSYSASFLWDPRKKDAVVEPSAEAEVRTEPETEAVAEAEISVESEADDEAAPVPEAEAEE